jgi:hypothetical protein
VNYTTFLIYIPLLGLVFGYTFWMKKKAAQAAVNARPAAIAYFERTGYCHADRMGMPPDVQADRATALGNDMMKFSQQGKLGEEQVHETHLIRNYHGLVIHYRNGMSVKRETGKTTTARWASFNGDLLAPPRVSIHIADRSLDSTMKAVGEVFSNSRRVFNPRCSQRIVTSIPEVDKKFVVYADDPPAAVHLLASNPALIELLQGWAEVDVAITRDGVFFNDPEQKNTNAAFGGTLGNMAIGFDHAKRYDLMIPVHDRIADLMLTLARTTA